MFCKGALSALSFTYSQRQMHHNSRIRCVSNFQFASLQEDTVSADEEDDEVKAHNHPRRGRASVCHDAVIHNSVPVLSGQDLTSITHLVSGTFINSTKSGLHVARKGCTICRFDLTFTHKLYNTTSYSNGTIHLKQQ